MALFGQFGGLAQGGLSILGAQAGGLGVIGQLGSAFVSGLQASRSTPAVGPAPMAMAGGGQVVQFAGRALTIGRSMLTRAVAPILIKVAEKLGRRSLSLRQAVTMIRRAGKFMEPAAIATALGITVAELAELIVADSSRPRRRMNPANSSALRRAARRIQSFHRLCSTADVLRGRGRARRSSRSGCPPGVQVVRGG